MYRSATRLISKCFFIFAILIYFGSTGSAESADTIFTKDGMLSYSYGAGFRNYPSGFSIGSELKASQFLWGANQNSVLFGLVQESLNIASHGLIGVNLNVYPISFVKLNFSKSYVSKYYEIKTLPCGSVECSGNLQRDTVSLALALAYQQFIFAPEWSQSWMTPQSQTIPFGSEDDYLVGAIKGDKVTTSQYLLGYRLQNKVFGLLVRSSQMQTYSNDALARYFIFQQPIQIEQLSHSPLKLTLGFGLYSSYWVETPQFSALIGIKGGGGNDPALF